jgi:hypothetical protein
MELSEARSRKGFLEPVPFEAVQKDIWSRGFLRRRKLSGAKSFEQEPSTAKYKIFAARILHHLKHEKLTRAETSLLKKLSEAEITCSPP